MPRKRRTREHIIHDLAVNHVERAVLLCGHSVERIVHDYGLDLTVFTYAATGELQNEQIVIQVKATDHLVLRRGGYAVTVRVRSSDIEAWTASLMPCILVLYDAQAEVAYWTEIHEELRMGDPSEPRAARHTVTLHLERHMVWGLDAVRQIVAAKNRVYEQLWRLSRDDD